MYEVILEVLFRVSIVIIITLFLPKLAKYLETLTADREKNKLIEIINTLVYAADQKLKREDPTGEKRKDYVIRELNKLGIEYSSFIDALVEESVFNIYDPKEFKSIDTDINSGLDIEPAEEDKPKKAAKKKNDKDSTK